MNTAANIITPQSSHWYHQNPVSPCYELPKKDGSGMKTPTLADARKLNLIPSVTTVLKVLDKPALNRWLIEQAVLACLTAPRLPDEPLDVFVDRVLNVERQQDQESAKARDIGKEIHDGIEQFLKTGKCSQVMEPYVLPVIMGISKYGRVIAVERIIAGDGYAGKLDLVMEGVDVWVMDFKSTKKIPKESYSEHRLQLAAYAKAFGNTGDLYLKTANVYISTTEPGTYAIRENPDWTVDYEMGFKKLVEYWQWANDYYPEQLIAAV